MRADASGVSIDPGIANVRDATAYSINGVSKTGNLVVPIAGSVKTGVTYDTLSSVTGTYTGSDRWSDPGEANVRLATAYQADSLTNNKTGTLDLPDESDVLLGVVYDNMTKTGTLSISGGSGGDISFTPYVLGFISLESNNYDYLIGYVSSETAYAVAEVKP